MVFGFQEVILQHLRDQKKNVYVILLDVQKAFVIVWQMTPFTSCILIQYQGPQVHLVDPEETVSID